MILLDVDWSILEVHEKKLLCIVWAVEATRFDVHYEQTTHFLVRHFLVWNDSNVSDASACSSRDKEPHVVTGALGRNNAYPNPEVLLLKTPAEISKPVKTGFG
jgi:hypothetical protein